MTISKDVLDELLNGVENAEDLPKHEKGLQHAAQSGSKFLK